MLTIVFPSQPRNTRFLRNVKCSGKLLIKSFASLFYLLFYLFYFFDLKETTRKKQTKPEKEGKKLWEKDYMNWRRWSMYNGWNILRGKIVYHVCRRDETSISKLELKGWDGTEPSRTATAKSRTGLAVEIDPRFFLLFFLMRFQSLLYKGKPYFVSWISISGLGFTSHHNTNR